MLETLLAQHFGQRISVKKIYEPVYGRPGGYDEDFKGYAVTLDVLADCEMQFFDAFDFFNKPAKISFIDGKIAQMRAVMARQNESNNDIALVIATYADHIGQYPPDIVAHVIDKFIGTRKWFPGIPDLRKEMDDLMSLRRNVLQAFERCRNPLMLGDRHAQSV